MGNKKWFLLIPALLVLAIIAAIALNQIEQYRLPVFTWSQETPDKGKFALQCLSHDGLVYVRDDTELRLVAVNPYEFPLSMFHFYGHALGKTDSLGHLYKIKGQDEGDYIVYDDGAEITEPQIFRKETVKPQDFLAVPIDQVILAKNVGMDTRIAGSNDPSLIKEIIGTLKEDHNIDPPFPEGTCYSAVLCSPDLPGLGYSLLITMDMDRHVYLQDIMSGNKVMPAGKLLTAWATSKIRS